ncbi:MAG TPA: hypothetical protein VKT32_05880 [Chthonomonadaceae bacterium]|nr:hypothetical protein [Chthonomonadaceae bacterium]
MNLSRAHLFATAAVASLIGLGAPAVAQSQPAGSPPPQGGMALPLPGGVRPDDPTHSMAWVLLSRKDVDTEIGLEDHQRTALAELQSKSREEILDRMRKAAAGNAEETNESPEERRLQFQQQMAQQRAFLEGYPDEMAKRAEGVLKPSQARRLRELDLQWRGPLALADPKVAEAVKLSADQRDKVAATLQDYQAAVMNIRRQIVAGVRPTGNAPQAPPTPPSAEEMQARAAKARKEMDLARQEAAGKALAVLSAEQQKRWQQMLGKPFTFQIT